MAELARNIKGSNPKAFASLTKSSSGMMPVKPPGKSAETAVGAAQELMYDAWEEGSKRERIRLAKQALLIHPDCADAYNLLATDAARSPEEKRNYYEEGMLAARRTLGEKNFKDAKGYFWGILDTRPYMRARTGLMQCLWDAGDHDAAIDHAREMLKLNPNDNQGIRYILASYLADLGRYPDLDKFINRSKYQNDCASDWLYTRALVTFFKKGDVQISRRALAAAIEINAYVPQYLTGKKSVPRKRPDSVTWGGKDEAFCYAAFNQNAWRKVPGALEWVEAQAFTLPKMSDPAKKRWNQIPEKTRQDILNNVVCTNCQTAVSMHLLEGTIKSRCLILHGKCKTCGGKVARLIETPEK